MIWCNAITSLHRLMKLIGFWLLLLLAVLVPATATVAASMICPPTSVVKQSPARGHAVQATAKQHMAAKATSHSRRAQAKADAKVVPAGDQPAQHCCDANPCSHCASCGTCASLAIGMTVETNVPLTATSSLPDPGVPRAEFLASGQERPPRNA